MKLGLDIHGVIDAKPEMFAELTSALVRGGHEVHILTGPRITDELRSELKNMGIMYTHIFSITSYHEGIGTDIEWDAQGNPHMSAYLWDKTKADYCKRMQIDLHLDDSDTYSYFFKTPYARFYSKTTERVKKMEI